MSGTEEQTPTMEVDPDHRTSTKDVRCPDVPSTSSTKKRRNDESTIVVDPNDESREVGTAKKPRIEIDEDQKRKCITAIVNSYLTLYSTMKLPVEEFYNLDVCTQLTNILFTGYSVLRQKANGTGKAITGKSEKSGFTVIESDHRRVIVLRHMGDPALITLSVTNNEVAKSNSTNRRDNLELGW
ncbi:unnamed protein product [Phaedon cochleariae]|uniref:Uncharacterized protein n=1 Tax=Phaedon cochleariae TaxID=80249 RepID=A0A9N9SDF2_PHACE|nr:unnamed protein product [Phaedon cochleariae]